MKLETRMRKAREKHRETCRAKKTGLPKQFSWGFPFGKADGPKSIQGKCGECDAVILVSQEEGES